MKTKPIKLSSSAENSPDFNANLAVCNCDNEVFFAFEVENQKHFHLQCVKCGVSYCPDGLCQIESNPYELFAGIVLNDDQTGLLTTCLKKKRSEAEEDLNNRYPNKLRTTICVGLNPDQTQADLVSWLKENNIPLLNQSILVEDFFVKVFKLVLNRI